MSRRRIILLIAAVVALVSLLGAGVLSQRSPSQRKIPTTIPPVYSKVRTLEVVSTKIINEDTPAAGVSVEIRNNSYKTVMAVDLVCGEGAITKNGLTDEENPIVVIEPYGTTTIEMGFAAMSPDSPLVVSAVTYDDGTEEGDEESLRIMHKIREHDRLKLQEGRAKQKERKP
jgi:hypothetical protein